MPSSRRSAFTLIELIVAIGIIGVLLGLLLPAIQNARGAAVRIECLNHQKQIGVALHHFHDTHGALPNRSSRSSRADSPNRLLSWMAMILPHVDQDSLYRVSLQACQADQEPLHNPPHVGLATVIPLYVCPADGRLGTPRSSPLQFPVALTSYMGNAGGFSLVGAFPDSPRLTQFTDGTSNTFLAGERPPPDTFEAGWWYPNYWFVKETGPHNYLHLGAPSFQISDGCDAASKFKAFGPGRTSNICDRYHYWSLHRGGANFLFADGSVRFFPYSAEAVVLSLASRSGGEVVEMP